ncbi:MAG: DUF5615 family PIN-like protein [Planctomycetota bacterium]
MQFFVDEDLPRSIAGIIARHGYTVTDIRDTDLRGADDRVIAAHARTHGLCIVTGDSDFADIRNYPPGRYHGIVVVRVPYLATTKTISELVTYFISQKHLVHQLPGRLAIVEAGRVRFRR